MAENATEPITKIKALGLCAVTLASTPDELRGRRLDRSEPQYHEMISRIYDVAQAIAEQLPAKSDFYRRKYVQLVFCELLIRGYVEGLTKLRAQYPDMPHELWCVHQQRVGGIELSAVLQANGMRLEVYGFLFRDRARHVRRLIRHALYEVDTKTVFAWDEAAHQRYLARSH